MKQCITTILLLITSPLPGKPNEKIDQLDKTNEKNLLLDSLSELSFGVGLGAILPEFFPIEGLARFKNIGVRAFYVPSLPFNVNVEYSKGVLANEGGLAVENPDLEIKFDGTYGPQWGLELQYFPFSGSFFVSIGQSRRSLTLQGGVSSPMILTSSAGSITTNSVFEVGAKARVIQSINRVTIGWYWTIQSYSYFSFVLGYTFPNGGSSQVDMEANIFNPSATQSVSNTTLEDAERQFELDMEEQTKDDVASVKELSTPIMGISMGIYLE